MMVQAATTSTPVIATNTEISSLEPAVVEAAALDVKELIIEESFRNELDPKLTLRIARCESLFRQIDARTGEPLRGVHNPKDVGVFQINETYHLEEARELGLDIYTLEGNVAYAMHILKRDGSRHWNWSKPCWSK